MEGIDVTNLSCYLFFSQGDELYTEAITNMRIPLSTILDLRKQFVPSTKIVKQVEEIQTLLQDFLSKSTGWYNCAQNGPVYLYTRNQMYIMFHFNKALLRIFIILVHKCWPTCTLCFWYELLLSICNSVWCICNLLKYCLEFLTCIV